VIPKKSSAERPFFLFLLLLSIANAVFSSQEPSFARTAADQVPKLQESAAKLAPKPSIFGHSVFFSQFFSGFWNKFFQT
jgi:hypothetical protein